VDNIKVISGHPLLIQAAVDALKQWKYAPQVDEVTTRVTIRFAF
jgi:outer membrane biosynthesis protein TonB